MWCHIAKEVKHYGLISNKVMVSNKLGIKSFRFVSPSPVQTDWSWVVCVYIGGERPIPLVEKWWFELMNKN